MSEIKRIVLTGASRGLGAALVGAFIERGHTVLACARSAEAMAKMQARYGSPHRFDAVDVTDDAAVKQWAEQILATGASPDLLINNAAVINHPAPLWEIAAAEFDELMRINVCGVANVIRQLVPAMIARGSGVIVNLSSGWGRTVSPEVAPYCASKFAIEGLTRALAEELPEGLAAVPLNPGVIDTDMLRSAWADGASAYPRPAVWAKKAVPYLLSLGPKDNGKPRSVPGAGD